MSLILVATVGGVLLERRSCARPERRVGVRRGRCGWTRRATVRGPPTAVFDRPLCQKKDPPPPHPSQARGGALAGGRGRGPLSAPDGGQHPGGRLADRHLLALPRRPVAPP